MFVITLIKSTIIRKRHISFTIVHYFQKIKSIDIIENIITKMY